MITVSTRASLKKYHTFNLILGQGDNGDEWELERIGTEREKMQVEKELQDLRERLEKVNEWKERREEIERELAAVWTDKGEALPPPSYTTTETEGEGAVEDAVEGAAEGEGEGERQVKDQAELEQSGEIVEASS